MCPELILAIIYFTIIFIINYLLFTMLKSYQTSIFSWLKFKNIYNSFSKFANGLKIIDLFLEKEKIDTRMQYITQNNQTLSKSEDLLIIGNLYKYLGSFEKNKKKSNSFYFQLLEKQYLSVVITLQYR